MLEITSAILALERHCDRLHPALLRLIRLAVEAAQRAGIELSVCGEMAGDPEAPLLLVGLGVPLLSMAPSSLATVRRAIRAAASSDLERAAISSLDRVTDPERLSQLDLVVQSD